MKDGKWTPSPPAGGAGIFSGSNYRKAGGAFLAGIVALGVWLRVAQYWDCRSLWLDEAGLALNFLTLDFGRVLPPLDNLQASPVGFNLLTVVILRMAGISEWSLRFLPFVCGLSSVFVFLRLSQRMLRGGGLLFANYVFAISWMFVYYGNEFKPYILDLFLSLVIFSGLLAWWEGGRPRFHLLWLAPVGCAAVWFSYPIVFLMAGVGGVLLLACWWEKKLSEFWVLAAVAVAWLISFGLQYHFFGRQVAGMSFMHKSWNELGGFMPLRPWKGESLKWYYTNFFDYFSDAGGLAGSRNIFQFIYIAGIISLVRREAWVWLGALVAPLLIVLLASGFELYPFHGRLILFTMPFAFLVCGEGINFLLATIPQPSLRYALLGVALFSPTVYSLSDLFQTRQAEDVRPIAQYVQQTAKPDDVVVVFKNNYTYQYYAARLNLKQAQIPLMPTDLALTPDDYASTLPRITSFLQAGQHGWLVISHAKDEEQTEVLARLQAICRCRLVKQQLEAQLYTLEPL